MADIPISGDAASVTAPAGHHPGQDQNPANAERGADERSGAPEATAHPRAVAAPLAAVARALAPFNRDQLGSAVEVLIALMDVADGDPDAENATDAEDDFALSPLALRFAEHGAGCTVSDSDAGAWIEWSTMSTGQRRGPNIMGEHEDDEEDDAPERDDHDEEDDPAGVVDEDGRNTITEREYMGLWLGDGPGCNISDPGENQQMQGDVPMLPAWSLNHNAFTDERTHLGIANLTASFRTNGGEVRSADTGATLVTRGWCSGPGAPV